MSESGPNVLRHITFSRAFTGKSLKVNAAEYFVFVCVHLLSHTTKRLVKMEVANPMMAAVNLPSPEEYRKRKVALISGEYGSESRRMGRGSRTQVTVARRPRSIAWHTVKRTAKNAPARRYWIRESEQSRMRADLIQVSPVKMGRTSASSSWRRATLYTGKSSTSTLKIEQSPMDCRRNGHWSDGPITTSV